MTVYTSAPEMWTPLFQDCQIRGELLPDLHYLYSSIKTTKYTSHFDPLNTHEVSCHIDILEKVSCLLRHPCFIAGISILFS